jgi:hypothetical protein
MAIKKRKELRPEPRPSGIDRDRIPGIVIADGRRSNAAGNPKITAFIWGGKVKPVPTLPFGRWRGVA